MGDLALRLLPQLRPRTFVVRTVILRVVILIGKVGIIVGSSVGLRSKLCRIKVMQDVGVLADFDLCSRRLQSIYFFVGTAFRHKYFRAITQGFGNQCNAQTCVTAAGFDKGASRMYFVVCRSE